MADPDTPTAAEVAALLDRLCSISGRQARFEDVPADELAQFEADKRALIERIDPEFYDS